MFNPEHISLSLTRNQFTWPNVIPNQSINLGLIPNPFLKWSIHIRQPSDHPIQPNLQSFCPSLQSLCRSLEPSPLLLSCHPQEAVLRAGDVTRKGATHEVHVDHKAEVRAVHQSEDIHEAREDIQLNDTIPEAHNVGGLPACGEAECIALIRAHTGTSAVLLSWLG
jgi:hypothetical protein